ncbi:hypothetical protein BLA60_24240 [Actinophytocola xinjiangensis]|uniref:Uncharacterized protein n=1 Tax=Actinophytocola xinjiangensis TaxID=485602 RepID=A0A7Z0WJA3_9PSEU|nr:hypothetical protein [Actinophytocola xinjiangensis]OLF07986.1 hypothetical protein BLA60_24240 [Actinophytocola xinjiangensis]
MLSSHVEWPDDPDPHSGDESPFAPRAPLRRLRVMIDGDLYRVPAQTAATVEEVLTGLLGHEHVTCFRYADNGPPPGTRPYELTDGGRAYEGWVTVDPPDGRPESRGIVFCANRRPVRATAYLDRRRHADEAVAYLDLAPEVAAARRSADALALRVALGMDADLFVTERPYLYLARGRSSRTKVARPAEALAVVGLYLRGQGVYSVDPPLPRGDYFAVGAMELMPAVWRWSAACHQSAAAAGLAGALIARVARALESRDTLHQVINRAKTADTPSAVLSCLDDVVLRLSSAVEISARVAHLALDLGERHPAGWQRQDWVKKVREKDKNLAALVGDRSPGRVLVKGIGALRDSLHLSELDGLLGARRPERPSVLVTLPSSSATELAALFDHFGTATAWGVHEVDQGVRYADPGVFVDQLVVRTIGFLNVVMARTPVERLPNVHGPLPDSPWSAGHHPEPARRGIRWQLGL